MATQARPNSLGSSSPSTGIAAPVDRMLFVRGVVRATRGPFHAVSTPGHLLHFVESGEVSQVAGGHREILNAGKAVWYHECEPVTGRVHQAPWRFLSIGFLAPNLLPPPENQRVFSLRTTTSARLRKLQCAWRDPTVSDVVRSLRCFGLLNEVLVEITGQIRVRGTDGPRSGGNASRWFKLENRLRRQFDEVPTLEAMAALAGTNVRTLTRSCHAATGLPPVRRLKQLRLHRAVFLLQLSDQTVTEIALSIGYERVQEFSREIRRTFGSTPLEIRRSGLQM